MAPFKPDSRMYLLGVSVDGAADRDNKVHMQLNHVLTLCQRLDDCGDWDQQASWTNRGIPSWVRDDNYGEAVCDVKEEEREEQGQAAAAQAAAAKRKSTGEEPAQKKKKTASKPPDTKPVTSGDSDGSDEEEEDEEEEDDEPGSSPAKKAKKASERSGAGDTGGTIRAPFKQPYSQSDQENTLQSQLRRVRRP